MSEKVRDAVPWLAALVIVGVACQQQWLGLSVPGWPGPESGPAKDVALAGGGMSDGDHCGVKGFHHFALPPATAGQGSVGQDSPSPGPQLVLGSYGYQRWANDPGYLTIDLLVGPGGKGTMDLSSPLGPQGVAVEIEGPDGLVGGAYGLPVKLDDPKARSTDGRIHVGTGGESAEVTVPVRALCPGYNGEDVQQGLLDPIDSHNTITGPPPYTLTVSVSDPAIGGLRRSIGSPVAGDVLSADNTDPEGD